jgi:hypothetical protein
MPDPETGEYTLEDVVNAIGAQTLYLAALVTDVDNLWNLFNRVLAMPKASTLVSEYYGNEDLDNNGLVFGYDFYISNPPKMLESIEFDTQPVSAMTWEEYLES